MHPTRVDNIFGLKFTGVGRLLPPIHIIEPNDVILAEIAADLYLNQFERDLSRISKAMNAADRNVDGFVLMNRSHVVVYRDLRCSLYNTQCSERWKCFCSERVSSGFTTMRLTRYRIARSTSW